MPKLRNFPTDTAGLTPSCGFPPSSRIWPSDRLLPTASSGSSDESACGQVHLAARQLESIIGGRVEVGFITTATPSVPEAVERASRNGRRVAIASYLLAPGLFHQRLHTYGADVVADPLGADQRIVDLIVTRMRAAISPYRRQAPVSG